MNQEAIAKLEGYCEWCMAQGGVCHGNLDGCNIFDVLTLLKQQPAACESDGWMKSATEYYENGNCPICFATDEAGHSEGCYLGQLEFLNEALLELYNDCRNVPADEQRQKVMQKVESAKAKKEGETK